MSMSDLVISFYELGHFEEREVELWMQPRWYIQDTLFIPMCIMNAAYKIFSLFLVIQYSLKLVIKWAKKCFMYETK